MIHSKKHNRFATGRAATCLTVCLIFGLDAQLTNAAEDHGWPGFRRALADGIFVGKSPLSQSDKCGLKLAWHQKLGSGYSGVAVADGCAITMFSDGKHNVVVALDAKTGQEKWRYALAEYYKGHDGSHDGPISTPLVADGAVYVLDPRGQFDALDLKTGEAIWKTHLVDEHKAAKPHYGFGTSPVFLDGVVVVQMNSEKAAVAGFDPETGKKLWSAGADGTSYQSPIHYMWNKKDRVLAACNKKLYAIDASNGDIVWEQEHLGAGARGLMSLTAVPAGVDRLFLAYKDESSALMQLVREEHGVSSEHTWEDRSIRNSYNVPVYHDGHVYAYSSRFLTCVEAETGKSKWKARKPGDGFLILVDGHLVIITKEGSLHIAKASPDGYNEIASLKVFEDLAWSHPSYSDGAVYVHSLDAMARIDIVPGATASGGTESMASAKGPQTRSQFHAFLREVGEAAEKQGVVDRFVAAQHEFPVTEEGGWVHFVYQGEGTDLAVAGDMFGARQEHPMERIAGTNFFYHSMQLEADARLNYVFMRDFDEIVDPRNDRKTVSRMLTKDMEMSFSGEPFEMSWFAMPKWKSPAFLTHAESPTMGRVDTHKLESKTLETKVAFEVYVPHGYDKSDTRYPVAYIHGGQAAKEHGRITEAFDHLCGSTIKPTMLVLINHRHRGPVEQYADMLAKELVPMIDEAYRTEKSADSRASIGFGFAGVTAFQCAAQHSDVIGNFASQSPFIFDAAKSSINKTVEDYSGKPLTVYLDWGKYDFRNPHEAWDIGVTAEEFASTLRKKGFKMHGGEVNDGTGWSSWPNRFDTMFLSLFPRDEKS